MKDSGFSLIEIIVAVGLAAIFLPAIGVILSFALFSASEGEQFSKAHNVAQEGMEAFFYLKSKNDSTWDWTTTPSNTASGEYYQPLQAGGIWQLGTKTTSPSVTQPPFTRKIELIQVCRNPSLTIADCSAPGASVDPYSRKVMVYVSWLENGQRQEVKLGSYVTAH